MKELIFVQFGEAGVQIGSECWQLFCKEHGLQPNGQVIEEAKQQKEENFGYREVLFQESSKTGHWTPRSLFVDLDGETINALRTGSQRNLFHPEFFISHKEDAAGIYSRARYGLSHEIRDQMEQIFRKLAESCDSLEGIITVRSLNGGTGSGIGGSFLSYTLPHVGLDSSSKIPNLGFLQVSSPHIVNGVTETYNNVLSFNDLLHYQSLCYLYDNEALYNICNKRKFIAQEEYQDIQYKDLNQLIALSISSITSSLRFGGAMGRGNVQEILTSSITDPLTKVKFVVNSYSPLPTFNHKQNNNNSQNNQSEFPWTTADISNMAFEPNNLMASIPLPNYIFGTKKNKEKFLQCSLHYRGSSVHHIDILNWIEDAKQKSNFNFLECVPCGFKVTMSSQTPIHPWKFGSSTPSSDKSLCVSANTTGVRWIFRHLAEKFDKIYAKRAFVHQYVGYMSEGEFAEAREDIATLEQEYKPLVDGVDSEEIEE